ncbi:hypothetical protein [Roseisolibacter agri]|uniref:Uncharacterized protein n=1 Tax=Roseisolibacter agri TaxID=2014610 RepID=A0AA37QKZ3_9BACT|nr:hypothetical protein [Roseisolibacter agri]GLC27713.1 hypothetical protein rosag_42260 [Roseisolibacter agri]
MRNLRITAALAVALLTGTAVACGPDRAPTAPAIGALRADVAPSADLLSAADGRTASWSVSGLRRERPLASDITVQQVIGPRGGKLSIPAAGFTLEVPAGAVATETTFSVTALAGEMLAYEFGPSGTSFPIALRGTQDLSGTLAKRLPRGATLGLGYFRAPSDVDASTGTAMVAQEVEATVDKSGHRLSFGIPHFSGWIILWRNGFTADSVWEP